MTRSARVLAQAKINLLLRVLARETSGYHAIETVFLRLDLGDDVCVRVAAGRSIDCRGPSMPAEGLGAPQSNLAYRAAAAYADATGWPSGFAIEIEKRIPIGGGLGGGSADAGAVLRALDALSPRPLRERLIDLAAPLGADVPFMTTEHAMALGWGRGERLLPLAPLASRPVLLAVPQFGIATGDAYGWLADDREGYVPHAAVLDLAQLASWNTLGRSAVNDFQLVVERRHPPIAEITSALRRAGASIAMLSGSGATVFGLFEEPPLPELLRELAATGVSLLQTRTSAGIATVLVEK
jgi:4-diphosphocytidyl-2-C-methyl-D-erythritol kinase